MASMHRLRPNQLHIGEGLPWDVFDLAGHLLLRRGFLIQRDETIDMLLERGMYVDAEEYQAYLRAEGHALVRRYDPLSTWQNVQLHLSHLYKNPPRDGSLSDEIEELAEQVVELCDKSPDLALAALMLLDYKRYPVAHSLHVAVLANLIAKRAQFSDDLRMATTCAALTMNIAMAELQQLLFHQRGPLSPEQKSAIDSHPAESAKLLIASGVDNDEWLRAVLEHHEEPDGSGYPRHTRTPSQAALLLHTLDVFTAMLCGRADRKPMLASHASKQIFVTMGQSQSNPFPALMIKELGIYPPGSLVKLANGEVGVVCKRGAKANAPIVATLINAKGLKQLDTIRRDTDTNPAFQIVAVMSRDAGMVVLNFEHIWCHH